MALTKSYLEIDAWAQIAQNAVRKGGVIDLSAAYGALLAIDVALNTETAHTGTRIIVQTATGGDDEHWHDFGEYIVLAATASEEAILNNPLAQGVTEIEVASLTGFTVATGGVLNAIIIDASSTEIVKIIATAVTGGNDTITLLDETLHEHAAATKMYNKVWQTAIVLPIEVVRARVIYDNLYHAAGSTVWTRARISKVTAVS